MFKHSEPEIRSSPVSLITLTQLDNIPHCSLLYMIIYLTAAFYVIIHPTAACYMIIYPIAAYYMIVYHTTACYFIIYPVAA